MVTSSGKHVHELVKSKFQKGDHADCEVCTKEIDAGRTHLHCQECDVRVHRQCDAQSNINSIHLSGLGDDNNGVNEFNSVHDHDFKVANFSRPRQCKACEKYITGIFKQGVKCQSCKLVVHFKCQELANVNVKCECHGKEERNLFKETRLSTINANVHHESPKVKFGFLPDWFGKRSKQDFDISSPTSVHSSNGFFSRFKFGQKDVKEERSKSAYQVTISGPTNFHHVDGTSRLKLISLDDARMRERNFRAVEEKTVN